MSIFEALGIETTTTAAGIGGFALGAFAMLLVMLCLRIAERNTNQILIEPSAHDVAGDYPNIDATWGNR